MLLLVFHIVILCALVVDVPGAFSYANGQEAALLPYSASSTSKSFKAAAVTALFLFFKKPVVLII